jgi:hypothetical protein
MSVVLSVDVGYGRVRQVLGAEISELRLISIESLARTLADAPTQAGRAMSPLLMLRDKKRKKFRAVIISQWC